MGMILTQVRIKERLSFKFQTERDIVFLYDAEETKLVEDLLETSEHAWEIMYHTAAPRPSHLRLLLKISRPGTLLALSNRIELTDLKWWKQLFDWEDSGLEIRDLYWGLSYVDPKVWSIPAALASGVRVFNQGRKSWRYQLYNVARRFLEPLAALIGLLFLSPLFLILAIAVKLTSRGPVLYGQVRSGLRGKTFKLWKFRSMRVDAEKAGPQWASASRSDARLTPIGAFLRGSHLDELPQLINIVLGQASLIGPRPERPHFNAKIEESVAPLFSLRCQVLPGVSGWAQVRSGYANTLEDSRRKLEFDLDYVFKRSLRLDLRIVIETVWTLVSGGTEGIKREQQASSALRLSIGDMGLRRRSSALSGGEHIRRIRLKR